MAQFTNQATLLYNGITTTSNITTGELLEVLSITKTAIGDTYSPGDAITYVVSIVNSGSNAFSNLSLSDDLGAYTLGTLTLTPLTYQEDTLLYYINGVQQAAPSVVAGPPLQISNINIPANGNAVIIYEAMVNTYAPLESGNSIINTVSLSGGGLASPVTADAQIVPLTDAQLTISKAMCPSTVIDNGQLTYTFVIQNSGNTPADAALGAIITDTFDPILNPITVSFNGNTWTQGSQYTYNAATGEFATVSGYVTVPAASYTQDMTTGAWIIHPGASTLTVTGTI